MCRVHSLSESNTDKWHTHETCVQPFRHWIGLNSGGNNAKCMKWALMNYDKPRILSGRCTAGRRGKLDAELMKIRKRVTRNKSPQIIWNKSCYFSYTEELLDTPVNNESHTVTPWCILFIYDQSHSVPWCCGATYQSWQWWWWWWWQRRWWLMTMNMRGT